MPRFTHAASFQKLAAGAALGTSLVIATLIFGTSQVHPLSKVRLRNVWRVYNLLAGKGGGEAEALHDLHEEVLQAELEAFGDSGSTIQAKRSLWDMQVEGAFSRPGSLFTPLGRMIFKIDLKLRLRRRLRFAEYVKREGLGRMDSSIETQRPIIIVGLPRTGSTMISRLLSADPKSRSPLYWEFAHDDDNVAPSDEPEVDGRAGPVEKGFGKLGIFSPNGLKEFKKFHHVSAMDHEEVTGFTRRYFFDMETSLLSPSSQSERLEWQTSEEVDRTFLAGYLKVWLRHQKRKTENEFWVLKSPAVTSWLSEYKRTFPNAVFVFTSRAPTSVVPSLCGLNEVALSLKYDYSNKEGLKPVGDGVIGRVAGYAKAQSEFFERNPDSCINLPYEEMIKDPIMAARRIYEFAGRDMGGEVEGRMREHMGENKKGKHGRAEYSLEKFGLTEEVIKEKFEGYEKFC